MAAKRKSPYRPHTPAVSPLHLSKDASDRETAEHLRHVLDLYLSEQRISVQLKDMVLALLRLYRGTRSQQFRAREHFAEWSLGFSIAEAAWLAVAFRKNDQAVRAAVGIAAHHRCQHYGEEYPTAEELEGDQRDVRAQLNKLDHRQPPTNTTTAGRIMSVLCPGLFPADKRPGVRGPRREVLAITRPAHLDP